MQQLRAVEDALAAAEAERSSFEAEAVLLRAAVSELRSEAEGLQVEVDSLRSRQLEAEQEAGRRAAEMAEGQAAQRALAEELAAARGDLLTMRKVHVPLY